MSHWLGFAVTRQTVIGVNPRSTCHWSDKAILEEVVEDDDEVPEKLVNGLLADGLFRGFWRVPCITQQKEAVLLV